MTGRPIDYQRRADLLDGAVDFAVKHGFSDLSWRPLAAALGVSSTTLVHHFGTKEDLLIAIQARLRERMFATARAAAGDDPDLATAARAIWAHASAPEQAAEFRLFFAVYGRALQEPKTFAMFLDHVVTDWLSSLIELQSPDHDPAAAANKATLVIATLRGLLLDLLATGDAPRIHTAADEFFASLR